MKGIHRLKEIREDQASERGEKKRDEKKGSVLENVKCVDC